jgi:hypothetical protein
MKKLVVFGDSFINYSWLKEYLKLDFSYADIYRSWTKDLGNKLQLPVLNYGSAGSSHAYAFHKFCDYFQSQDFYHDDIIIFQSSDLYSRSYALNMPPHLGSVSASDNSYGDLENKWIKQNFESYIWYMFHNTHESLNFDLIQMLSFFQIWCSKNKSNKFLFLRGFSNNIPDNIEKLNLIITPTENFYPIISPENSLFQISLEEFSKQQLVDKFLKKSDKRINHLTNVNRNILVQMIFEIFNTGSVNAFDRNKFVKNIYNKDEDIKYLWSLQEPI